MADPLLELSHIRLRYGRREVLDDVGLAVEAGRIVTLIGPNGSGKTSLVRVSLGLIRPDGGTVRRKPGLTIGYMPQKLHIDPVLPITVRRFLTLGRRVGAARLAAALEEVRAGHVLDTAVQEISGGEMQRVMLARALLREPQLLVLDEPVQGVDVTGQAEFYALIAEIRKKRGCGVLMVSHDLHLVMAATDHVICLNTHVCCAGTPSSVSVHPEFTAIFGADVARTLAVYAHAPGHDHRHDHGHGHGHGADHAAAQAAGSGPEEAK